MVDGAVWKRTFGFVSVFASSSSCVSVVLSSSGGLYPTYRAGVNGISGCINTSDDGNILNADPLNVEGTDCAFKCIQFANAILFMIQ